MITVAPWIESEGEKLGSYDAKFLTKNGDDIVRNLSKDKLFLPGARIWETHDKRYGNCRIDNQSERAGGGCVFAYQQGSESHGTVHIVNEISKLPAEAKNSIPQILFDALVKSTKKGVKLHLSWQ